MTPETITHEVLRAKEIMLIPHASRRILNGNQEAWMSISFQCPKCSKKLRAP